MDADTTSGAASVAPPLPDDAELSAAAAALGKHLEQAKANTAELARLRLELEAVRAVKDRFEHEARAAESKLQTAQNEKDAAVLALAPLQAERDRLRVQLDDQQTRLQRYRAFVAEMTGKLNANPPSA